ncbi:MAG: type VI secretion system tube protein TssD [Prevotellaceae bacterium]|nr:type VI secretion system tube protein TssD [Prevotellaceae bacterium]
MNIIAHLQFGDNETQLYSKEYLVVKCRTHVHRSHNSFHPDSEPTCEAIEVTVVSPHKDDHYLYEWYLANLKSSGCLQFDIDDVRRSGGEVCKRYLYFEGAQCFSIHENYDIQSSSRRLLTLYITADHFTADNVGIGSDMDDTYSF